MTQARLVLSWPDGAEFGGRLAEALDCGHAVVETRRFPDGESYVRLPSSVAGMDVIINRTMADPDPRLASLLFAADAARELGAARVGLVAPYLAYMRQDRRFHPGEAITSRSFARVLSAGLDWLVTVDPHLHHIPSLDEIYTIPSRVVRAAPLLAKWIRQKVGNPLLIGPDAESEQWVAEAAAGIGAPFAVFTKTRLGDHDVRLEMPDLSAHAGRTPVLIDDVASSGRTLVEAARLLAKAGFAKPFCAVIHPLFAGNAFADLQDVTEGVVSADTIPHPSNNVHLANEVANAIMDIPGPATPGDREKSDA